MRKETFRKRCIERLRKTASHNRGGRDRAVVSKLEKIIKKYNPKEILAYLPMPHEVDIRPMFRRLRRGRKLYVPFMEGESFRVVQYRLPLHTKRYGIKEPGPSRYALSKIDMAIVPVVGVDGRLRRIGFGKGMYDRFFQKLGRKPLTVFVQLTSCRTREVVTDDHDVQADIYITPEETIIRGK